MRTLPTSLVVLSILMLLPAGGCGGSSGGGTPVPPDVFSGTYGLSQFRGEIGPPLTASAYWGTIQADGLGSIPGGTSWGISNGSLSGPTPSPASLSYVIQPAHGLQWLLGPSLLADGGISADGDLFVLGLLPGSGAGVVLGARKGDSYTDASISGTYHVAQLGASPGGTSDAAFWGVVMFDGSGGANFALYANIDGTVSGPTPSSGTYAVAPDGALSITTGSTTLSGQVARSGDLGFYSGSTTAGGAALFGVFVAYSAAASATDFNGAYRFVAMNADSPPAPPINWRALNGALNADGVGTYTLTSGTLVDDAGTVTPLTPPFLPTPFTVVANGGMTIAGGALVGAMTEDGSAAAFVGSTISGSPMTFWILVR